MQAKDFEKTVDGKPVRLFSCCEHDNEILSFINMMELLDWQSKHKLDKTVCTPVC